MQLYLIRHAESANNSKPPQQRIEDPPITELGQQQAEHLANWAQTLKIDTLITSPFLRTLQTTRSILDARHQHVHVWHDLFERGGCYRGFYEHETEGAMGLGRSQILRQLDRRVEACSIDETISESGWWGGQSPETDQQAKDRATKFVSRLESTFGSNGETILAVTHADFKRLILGVMLHQVLDPARLGPLRNAGITKVDFDGTTWQLDWLNSVSHMPAELITGNES